MEKILFSVLIYEIFKAFMEAMKYTLFEVTAGLKFYTNFCFKRFDLGQSKSGKNVKTN